MSNDRIGLRLSFILDTILRDKDKFHNMSYDQLQKWYDENIDRRIEKELELGDWISTYNGSMFTKTFTPTKKD